LRSARKISAVRVRASYVLVVDDQIGNSGTTLTASARILACNLKGIAKLFAVFDLGTSWTMKIPPSLPRLKGFRFPREIVAYAVWAYYRFALSTADVEDLLAERGVIVSREAIRLWVNRFRAVGGG